MCVARRGSRARAAATGSSGRLVWGIRRSRTRPSCRACRTRRRGGVPSRGQGRSRCPPGWGWRCRDTRACSPGIREEHLACRVLCLGRTEERAEAAAIDGVVQRAPDAHVVERRGADVEEHVREAGRRVGVQRARRTGS